MLRQANIFLILLLIFNSISGQGVNYVYPDPPSIEFISVDTSSYDVHIRWQPSPSDSVDRYIIYNLVLVDGEYAGFEVGEVDNDSLEFFYPTPASDIMTVSMAVASSDKGFKPGDYSAFHSTMFLTAKYDSCEKTMSLDWSSYVGWEALKYEVYCRVDQGPYEIIDPHGTDSIHYLQREILANHSYCYFIKAVKGDLKTFSFSNIVCRNISHPLHPEWINAESASALGEDKVEVKFVLAPGAEVTSYQLYRSAGPGKPFKPEAIIRNIQDSVVYADPVVSTTKRYQYKLYSLDVCDKVFAESESNISGNIVLTATSTGLEGFLSWNPYVDYESGVENYRIYRDINHEGVKFLYDVDPSDTMYQDHLSDISSDYIEDEICYMVEAVENPAVTKGKQGFSRSNLACISVVPEIMMANAMIPNSTFPENTEIRPELTYIPDQYLFQVYDRWGSRIFETNSYDVPWKGMINNQGAFVPEGVYVYYIKLTTSSGIEITKTGEITVFYK